MALDFMQYIKHFTITRWVRYMGWMNRIDMYGVEDV